MKVRFFLADDEQLGNGIQDLTILQRIESEKCTYLEATVESLIEIVIKCPDGTVKFPTETLARVPRGTNETIYNVSRWKHSLLR